MKINICTTSVHPASSIGLSASYTMMYMWISNLFEKNGLNTCFDRRRNHAFAYVPNIQYELGSLYIMKIKFFKFNETDVPQCSSHVPPFRLSHAGSSSSHNPTQICIIYICLVLPHCRSIFTKMVRQAMLQHYGTGY